ncbi:S-layer homology domain-containing protein [Cohnella panacarvi]|uniref:S-layer homology domain-containing protein n=1 Tax=Cohnella panacarvi TaxID=400776 RepID=UPI00047E7592|nr:S-layer homology domain-containing protein [Cohnella panacarvi]
MLAIGRRIRLMIGVMVILLGLPANQGFAATIYNQDGFGYSGTGSGNPLGTNIVMTGYNDWPTGYTHTNGFYSSTFDGQNIWMIPFGGTHVVKINKNSGEMTGYNTWPEGFVRGSSPFTGGVFDGQNIWLIPYGANSVVKVNKDTGIMTGYKDWPAGFTLQNGAFAGGIYDGQNIWLAPRNADRVIKIDKATGTMTGYNDWPAGFTKGSSAFSGATFDGRNIWMVPQNADRVIKFDTITGTMTGYNDWPAGFVKGGSAFEGGIFEGQHIWLVPYDADRMIKIDKDTGTMTGYNNWPAGFTKGNTAFSGGTYDGQNIWLVPARASQVIKFNTVTESMTGYNTWPAGFTKGTDGFGGAVFDGQNIWMSPYNANYAIKISSVSASGLTVTTDDPTGAGTNGHTHVNIAETVGTGNTFKYKNFASSSVTTPNEGVIIGADYSPLPPNGIVAAANGDKIAVVEVDASSAAVRFGQATAVVIPDAATPSANPAGGAVAAGTMVELTTITPDATIYYTVDGTVPTSSSLVYTAPISVTSATTIKAIAKAPGLGDSGVMSESYTILIPGVPALVSTAAGDGQATVNWSAVSGATSYKVYQSTTSNSYGAAEATVSGSVYSATITGLTNGTVYYFKVSALIGSSESAKSNEVSATPQVAQPGAPVLQPATSGDTQISLTWSPAVGATGYKIFKSTTSGAYGLEDATVSGSVYSYNATGLTNGTTYYFVVKATNPGGDSAASNEVSATPVTVPAAPTGVTAVAGNGQATVSFTAPANGESNITHYVVTAMPGNISVTGTDSSITVTGLSNGVAYTFTVQAVNSAGSSVASDASHSVTPRSPSSGTPTTPTTPPDSAQKPAEPEPTVEVFNSSIINETNLVKMMESKAAEAKEANTATDFADSQGHWAEKTIDLFIQLKVISGYQDGTFRPNSAITRAEFAALLNRVFNIQGGSHTNTALKDIDGSWAKEAIENLVAARVITGYKDDTFRPNQTITREEMVVMLSRIVNLSGVEKDTTKGNFNDLNGAYAADEIQASAQAGIVSGKGDGQFDPQGNATRAEALQTILNVLKLNPQLKTLLESLS